MKAHSHAAGRQLSDGIAAPLRHLAICVGCMECTFHGHRVFTTPLQGQTCCALTMHRFVLQRHTWPTTSSVLSRSRPGQVCGLPRVYALDSRPWAQPAQARTSVSSAESYCLLQQEAGGCYHPDVRQNRPIITILGIAHVLGSRKSTALFVGLASAMLRQKGIRHPAIGAQNRSWSHFAATDPADFRSKVTESRNVGQLNPNHHRSHVGNRNNRKVRQKGRFPRSVLSSLSIRVHSSTPNSAARRRRARMEGNGDPCLTAFRVC
jgi:hypothetical protein